MSEMNTETENGRFGGRSNSGERESGDWIERCVGRETERQDESEQEERQEVEVGVSSIQLVAAYVRGEDKGLARAKEHTRESKQVCVGGEGEEQDEGSKAWERGWHSGDQRAPRRWAARLPPLSGSTLDFLGTLPRTASLDELKGSLERRGRAIERRGRESLRRADEKAHEVFQRARRRYLAHELLLLAFYQRRSPRERWIDPLARWRALWRLFGTLALLANALFFTSAAWLHWRCEMDPLCDLSGGVCPHWSGTAPVRELLIPIFAQLRERQWPKLPAAWAQMPGPGMGCRRALGALISGMAVQGFSLAELALGVKTATLYGGIFGSSPSKALKAARGPAGSSSVGSVLGGLVGDGGGGRRLHYGTSYGRLAWALVGLDLALAVPWTLAIDLLLLVPWESSHEPSVIKREREASPIPRWSRPFFRWLRERRWWRTVVGWQRLTALPPAPYPVQWTLDTIVVPAWLGTGHEATKKLIRLLPSIGDAILEAEMLQAFVASFFASAKMLVLVASMVKAARVRRRLDVMRRQNAARLIVTGLRRAVARARVQGLQRRLEVGATAAAVLHERAQLRQRSCRSASRAAADGAPIVSSVSVPHELSAYLPHELLAACSPPLGLAPRPAGDRSSSPPHMPASFQPPLREQASNCFLGASQVTEDDDWETVLAASNSTVTSAAPMTPACDMSPVSTIRERRVGLH